MVFSYSGITNYGKVTLPSTEAYGTDMNILRDPPKWVHTRRIDKVGETSDITAMRDESGNRACEGIRQYATGVNPMVSVSYSNEGNNGGERSGGLTAGGRSQAFLPYRVIRDGAFRPPVLTQEQLQPQSRQSRVWTTAFSNPDFPDFSRKVRVCGTDKNFREVKNETLKGSVRPTAVFRIETPLVEPYEAKYAIQNPIKTSAEAGFRTSDITTQYVQEPTKETRDVPLHAYANPNASENRYVDNSQFNPERYIQDSNVHAANTNQSSRSNVTSITDLVDLSDLPVRNIQTTSRDAPLSGYEKNNLHHQPIHLERSLPEYQAETNRGQDIYKPIKHENVISFQRNMPLATWEASHVSQGGFDHGSRDYRLAPKISPGGYNAQPHLPMHGRMQNVREAPMTQQAHLGRAVSQQFESRWP